MAAWGGPLRGGMTKVSDNHRPLVLADERRQRIKEMANETDFLRVADLSNVLGVSAVAIRRDLRVLAAQGELRKVRGGATSERRAPVQTAFDEKMHQCRARRNASRNGRPPDRAVRPSSWDRHHVCISPGRSAAVRS
jgi:hypothetical protein